MNWKPRLPKFLHRKNLPTQWPTPLAVVFLLSFLVGAVSGGVFGILAVTLFEKAVQPGGSTTIRRFDSINEVIPDVVRQSAPAVVSIAVTKDVQQLQQVNPFGNFFFGFPNPLQPQVPDGSPSQKQKVGGGSGFFVTSDGLIVTNKHVVQSDDAEYTVFTNDNKQYNARVVSRDPANDIAIIQIDGNNFPTLPLGDSEKLQLGESVVAIGNALGEFPNTVSTGIVSGLARHITASGGSAGVEQLSGVIQTDAAINPGNSGGPLLNLQGEVIGVNSAVDPGAQNIGFAIAINDVKSAVESVKKSGKIIRPFLGVQYLEVTKELADEKQLPVDYGAVLVRGEGATDFAVVPGSPANKAGLVENDIILEIDGQKLDANNQLAKIVSRHNVGDTLTLKVYHQGTTKSVAVTLVERK